MIIQADSRHIPLPNQSVNAIITSPPYWSLRKYDIPDLIWDGNFPTISSEGCEHEWINDPVPGEKSGKPGPNAAVGARFEQDAIRRRPPTNTCGRCGVWRGQLGLEPTIDLYLKHLLQIMDECKRVLRDDGTMWVNLGDSYASGGGHGVEQSFIRDQGKITGKEPDFPGKASLRKTMGKSLCLIPERFAIEMINRGWILRNKIIWHKPNCMPASVKDRFTCDFEPVFFFVKSRKYWFEQQYDDLSPLTLADKRNDTGRHTQGKNYSKYFEEGESPDKPSWYRGKVFVNPKQGRNKRSVWTIPTQPYPESHFATFPEKLVEPMIKAGCPQFVCKKCGKAREKIVKVTSHYSKREQAHVPNNSESKVDSTGWKPPDIEEIGLTDCGCNAGFEPGIVLDPFCGSGTVLRVAKRLQRKAIGIDLGYQELSEKRRKWNQVEMTIQ